MPRRQLLLLAGIAALALGLGAFVAERVVRDATPLRAATLLPEPRALPEFTLATAAGPLARAALAGRWTIVFFGYTRCPDVCPTTLALLAQAAKRFAALPAERRPRVLFVSVDPARDSTARTADFARWFDASFVGATVSDAELGRLAAALGAPYAKRGDGDDYAMDHPAALFLLDPQARFAGVVTPPLDAASVGDDLLRLAEHG